jgi:hypothetical protein
MAYSKNRILRLALGAAMSAVVVGGASANIVYSVNQAINLGSVTGSVTTDGHTGTLLASDFTGWNLTLSIPSVGETYVLTDLNSVVYVQGSDVTATSTQISFDFSGVDNGILLFQNGLWSGAHYWCNATSLGACYQGKTVVPIDVFTAYSQVSASGAQVIAGVPEPASWAMLLVGFAGLGLIGRYAARKDEAVA